MKKLLIGCNSYLGQNILNENKDCLEDWCISSRNKKTDLLSDCNVSFIQSDITKDNNLYGLNVEELYLISRPYNNDFNEHFNFHCSLKNIIINLCSINNIKKIVFPSSQMVYESTDEKVDLNTNVIPYGVYEYFKIDMEIFLKYIYLNYNVEFVNIYRLPILFGGIINEKQNKEQYLYSFINNFKLGKTWNFENDREKDYGVSWCYMSDLVNEFKSNKQGYRIINSSSGFINYFNLNNFMIKTLQLKSDKNQKLYKSRMEMQNNSNLAQKDFLELLKNNVDNL